MRFPLLFVVAFSASTALAQADLWSHVPTTSTQQLEPASLSSSQLKAVGDLIRHAKPDSIWECQGPDLDEVINGLRFETIPMPAKEQVVLAEAPSGCARGGQGANGAMWLIRLDGAKPVLLATPDAFSGWLFAVLPDVSNGYPNMVTGWHMSAGEAGLSYLRFDGKMYRSIGNASLLSGDDDHPKIVPAKP